jgi:hypothetical protein
MRMRRKNVEMACYVALVCAYLVIAASYLMLMLEHLSPASRSNVKSSGHNQEASLQTMSN